MLPSPLPSHFQLIGVAVQQRPWLMVLEFLQYGDMRNLLKGCAAKHITLDYPEQLSFAAQVRQRRPLFLSIAQRPSLMDLRRYL